MAIMLPWRQQRITHGEAATQVQDDAQVVIAAARVAQTVDRRTLGARKMQAFGHRCPVKIDDYPVRVFHGEQTVGGRPAQVENDPRPVRRRPHADGFDIRRDGRERSAKKNEKNDSSHEDTNAFSWLFCTI